jgi:hypothetical protein
MQLDNTKIVPQGLKKRHGLLQLLSSYRLSFICLFLKLGRKIITGRTCTLQTAIKYDQLSCGVVKKPISCTRILIK